MSKIKQILLGAIVIGQACLALHAVDSDDLKQYGKIGVSVVSLLLGAHIAVVAYMKHRATLNPVLLKRMAMVSVQNQRWPFLLTPLVISSTKKVLLDRLTRERNIDAGVAAVLIAGGTYGLSRSLK